MEGLSNYEPQKEPVVRDKLVPPAVEKPVNPVYLEKIPDHNARQFLNEEIFGKVMTDLDWGLRSAFMARISDSTWQKLSAFASADYQERNKMKYNLRSAVADEFRKYNDN